MSDGLIWLASYPKSGNTWVRLFLAAYLADDGETPDLNNIEVGIGIASNRRAFDEVIGVPSADLTDDEVDLLRPHVYEEWARTTTNPYPIVKVHDANLALPDGRSMFPASATRCVVYLVRHPGDVAVSNAFHSGHEDYDRSIDRLLDEDAAIAGNRRTQLRQRLGSWSTHVRSWERDDVSCLCIRYEDLVAEPATWFDRLVQFLELPEPRSTERLLRALHATEMGALQRAEASDGFRERPARQRQFFRRGVSGAWIDDLTAEQQERLLAGTGVSDPGVRPPLG